MRRRRVSRRFLEGEVGGRGGRDGGRGGKEELEGDQIEGVWEGRKGAERGDREMNGMLSSVDRGGVSGGRREK